MEAEIIPISRALKNKEMGSYINELKPEYENLIWLGVDTEGKIAIGHTYTDRRDLALSIWSLQSVINGFMDGSLMMVYNSQEDLENSSDGTLTFDDGEEL